MKGSLALLALLLCAVPAFASVSVREATKKTIDVAIVDEPLSTAVAAIQPFLGRDVHVLLAGDPLVTWRASRVTPAAALRAIASAAKVQLVDDRGRLWIRDTKEPSVTLDVKDAEARTILESMQKQCAIRNMIIDPDVKGTGTFLFRDVPCATAFDVVLRSLGLSSTTYGTSVMAVGARTR